MEGSTEQKAYRLAGFCKKCRKLGFGYLIHGTGPFICYRCAQQQNGTAQPIGRMYYTWTTGTSSTTTTTHNYKTGTDAT